MKIPGKGSDHAADNNAEKLCQGVEEQISVETGEEQPAEQRRGEEYIKGIFGCIKLA